MHGKFPMTSSYKRKSYPYRSYGPTKVNLTWSQQYSAYALKFMDTGHFGEMTPIMNFLKAQPYGEYTYDPDNKIWYFDEKHLKQVRVLIDAFGPSIFETHFQEKPQNQSFTSKFVSVDTYLDRFKELTGEDIRSLEYNNAKKIYRRICMLYHPDRHPGDSSIAIKMSSINETWTEL